MTAIPLPLGLFVESIGAGEWLFIALLVLIVYGPNRLPGIMRNVGRWISKLNQTADHLRQEISHVELEIEDQAFSAEPKETKPASPEDQGPSA